MMEMLISKKFMGKYLAVTGKQYTFAAPNRKKAKTITKTII